MNCPECGSEEQIRDAGGIFCRSCGLELEDSVIVDKGHGTRKDAQAIVLPPRLEFVIDPEMEVYALKLGLKHNKLSKDWTGLLGFRLKDPFLAPALKQRVSGLVGKAFEHHGQLLDESKKYISERWSRIDGSYWVGMEKLMGLAWPSQSYRCFLSLVCNGGFHNSSKSFIIVQARWREFSNYVIAHELFHIAFRNYVNRFFKEKYDAFDDLLSEVVVNFVLLAHPTLMTLFTIPIFSMDTYALDRHREMAEKLLPVWKEKKTFKEFMIESYRLLGRDKLWIGV